MKHWMMTGAAALAMTFASVAAHAGAPGGGNPPPSDPCESDPDSCSGGGGGGELPGDGGSGGGGSGGGSGGSPTTPVGTSAIGTGVLVFTLDNLPTGPSGTFATFQPLQDNSALGLGTIPSAQGGLNQTVGGTTLSLRTADYVYDPANPGAAQTRIGTENESTNFGYLGVPADVQIAISGTTFSPAAPGAIFANFSDTLSYFSVNAFRLAGTGSFDVTLQAYSGLNGTGTLLGSTTSTIGGGTNYVSQVLALSDLNGAASVSLLGSSNLAHYDNITATLGAPAATPEVPEPATWALFVGGFGLIGGAMRRRKVAVTYA